VSTAGKPVVLGVDDDPDILNFVTTLLGARN
jgi:hypothetical protein